MNNTERKYKINLEAVLEETKKLSDNFSLDDAEEVIKLLGGNRLYEIFDKSTISAIINSLKDNGSFYTYEGKKYDISILEGLLNNEIIDGVETFLCVKPEYILELPNEQKEKIAKSFTGTQTEEKELLLTLWNLGIQTIACGGEDEYIYLYLKVDKSDELNLIKILEFAKNNNNRVNLKGADDNYIEFTIVGDRSDFSFYSRLNKYIHESKTSYCEKFYTSIFNSLDCLFPFYTEYYEFFEKYNRHSPKEFTVEDIEQHLKDQREILDEQHATEINDLKQKLKEEREKNRLLQMQNKKLKQKLITIRSFVIDTLGQIPIWGKVLLKKLKNRLSMDQSMTLPKGRGRED